MPGLLKGVGFQPQVDPAYRTVGATLPGAIPFFPLKNWARKTPEVAIAKPALKGKCRIFPHLPCRLLTR